MLPLPLHSSHLASDFTSIKTGFLSILVLRDGLGVDLTLFTFFLLVVVSLDRFLVSDCSVFDFLAMFGKGFQLINVMTNHFSNSEVLSIVCFNVR